MPDIPISSECTCVKVIEACISSLKKENTDLKKAKSALKLKYDDVKCNININAI